MKRVERYLRIGFGLVVVCAVLAVPWLWLDTPAQANQPGGSGVLPSLWRYWTGERRVLWLRFSRPTDVEVGDPIFIHDAGPEHPASLRRVGEIQGLYADGKLLPAERGDVREARALIYPAAPALSTQSTITYRTKPDSVAWVIGALLTPERKERIAAELKEAAREHRDEIVAALRPVIEHALEALGHVLRQDVPVVLARHEAELSAIAEKYRRELLDEQWLPLVQEEIWPIVRHRVEPVAREVGLEMWQHISLWRFGWRLAYDVSPLPEKNLADREWTRFVENDALPILRRHADDFVKLIKEIIHDVATSARVRAAAQATLERVADDPQLHAVLLEVFREAVLENPHVRETLDRELSGPEASHAFSLASDRLEPFLRRIGDMIFGTQAAGITPEFAEVLRTEILDKDRRWFLLDTPPGGPPLAAATEGEWVDVRYVRPQ